MEDPRIIGLLDVDSFECQIYQNECPEWKRKPCVVADVSGRIVSVTYEATKFGLDRTKRVRDVDVLDPFGNKIKIFEKPQMFNKPDSSKCRHASSEITDVVRKYCSKRKIIVERVPTDEWFLDLTDRVKYLLDKFGTNYTFDFEDDQVYLESKTTLTDDEIDEKINWLATNCTYYTEEEKLVVGASVVKRLYDIILEKTDFICSAGISYNKLLAKQALKIHKPKPNIMTIISSLGLNRLSKSIPVQDIWGLGGELGKRVVENLPHLKTMADLKKIRKSTLIRYFEEHADFLYDRARGICDEEVIQKTVNDTVNSGKANFNIKCNKKLRKHLVDLSKDMVNRLQEEKSRNRRCTNSLKIQFRTKTDDEDDDDDYDDETENCVERTFNYNGQDYRWIAQSCFDEIREWGFHSYSDTVISELKLTAKNFYQIQ